MSGFERMRAMYSPAGDAPLTGEREVGLGTSAVVLTVGAVTGAAIGLLRGAFLGAAVGLGVGLVRRYSRGGRRRANPSRKPRGRRARR